MQDSFMDDEWKFKLIDALIGGINGNKYNLIDVGYYYQCCAPASIYKYYPNTERKLSEVKENKMWYSAPSKFNDPFDCEFMMSEEKIFQYMLQNVPGKRSIRAGSPVWKAFKGELHRQIPKLRNTFEHARHTTGVSCFSEKDDSMLMWAHYANNHKGMCVEYELMEFNTQLQYTPVPIIYCKDRVHLDSIDIDNVGTAIMEYFIKCLVQKSTVWGYESEWRIIRDDAACGHLWDSKNHGALLNSIRPSSITLGCEAEDSFIKGVTEYCQENKINLFRMYKDRLEYRLNKASVLQFDTEETFDANK